MRPYSFRAFEWNLGFRRFDSVCSLLPLNSLKNSFHVCVIINENEECCIFSWRVAPLSTLLCEASIFPCEIYSLMCGVIFSQTRAFIILGDVEHVRPDMWLNGAL